MSRLFIGRLSYRARENDVEKFFRGFGKIRDINLKNGYGFVEFDDSRDAEDAVYEMNNRDLCGERVTVEHARGVPRSGGERRDYGGRGDYGRDHNRGGGGGGGGGGGSFRRDDRRVNYYESRAIGKYGPPTRTEYRVIVENLSTRVSWQDLKDYLREAGEVTYADAHKHRRNEGVVDFASYEDMKRAIEKLDDTEINGRKIRLIEDKSSRSMSHSRSRSGSRYRSRSPHRSRSRSRGRGSKRSRSRSASRSHSRHSSMNGDTKKGRRDSRSRSRSHSVDERNNKSRSYSRSRSPENDRD